MPYHIKRKYYKQLAEHGYINYADDFRKHYDNGMERIMKHTGEYKAYKQVQSMCYLLGETYPCYSLEEINTPPDLPSEWWRKEE